MSRVVAKYFILTSLVFFLAGCLEGLMFPTKTMFQDLYSSLFQLPPAQIKPFFNNFVVKIHTHINLIGWMGSALMGILYVIAPQIAGQDRANPNAALANYFCNTAGVVLLAVGFHLIGHFGAGLPYESPEFRAAIQPVKNVAMVGGGLVFVSALLFVYNMGRTLLGTSVALAATQSGRGRAPMAALILAAVTLNLTPFAARPALAGSSQAPDHVDAIMVGDRLVDAAYNLGVLPKAMAVRATFWPLTETFKGGSEILGCPSRVLKKPETVPDAAKRLGVTRIILEKNAQFCTYMPSVSPEKLAVLLQGKGLRVEYVDFNQGLENAVRQTAALLGREDRTNNVLEKYAAALTQAKQKAKAVQHGKKVLVLSGIQQRDTGKVTIQIEAPGGYTDRFILAEMGATNVGQTFAPQDGKAAKGYFTAPKRKHGVHLDAMLTNAPDVIAIFGNVYAVQKALATAVRANPTLAKIPAIRNHAIYVLPQYVDSGVLEYPEALTLWADALAE